MEHLGKAVDLMDLRRAQPVPKKKGVKVPPVLISFIREMDLPDQVKQNAVTLVTARDSLGKEKYGQSLMSDDGRDPYIDALQELGDLLQYLMQCRLNGVDVAGIRELLPILKALCKPEKAKRRDALWCGFF